MASEIDELISEQSLKNWNQFVASLDKAVVGLDRVIQNSTELDSILGKLGISSQDVRNAQDAVNKAQKEATKIQKQLQNSEDDIVKAKIKFNKATKEQREHLAAIITLEEKNVGTLEKLAARNKLLREEQRKLNLETGEGIKRNKEINKEIDKNTSFIKKNSDALVKQKMSIGGYSAAITGGIKQLIGFAGVTALAVTAINKLKEAFIQTEKGANLFSRSMDVLKTIGQGIVSGSNVKDIFKNAILASNASEKLNEIRKGDRKDLVEIAKLEAEINILRYKAADATLSEAAQLEALTKAQAKEDELIQYKIADKQEELNAVKELLATRKDDVDLMNKQAQLEADLITIAGDRNLRLESRASALREKLKANAAITDQSNTILERQAGITKLNTEAQLNAIDVTVSGKERELQLNQAVLESNNELHNQMLRNAAEEAEILRQKQDLQAEIMASSFEIGQNLFDAQLQRLEMQQAAELKLVGDNAAAKEAIEEKYNKKKIALQRKAALVEKVQGVFSIGIDTARGVMNAISKVSTIPLVPWIIAMGALQMAAVASKPLPQYAKGTKYSQSGPAIVGEKGRELMISPSGQVGLTGSSAELVNLQRGTKIIPAGETATILKSVGRLGRNNTIEKIIERGNKDIVKAIQNKETIILKTGVGNSIEKRQGVRYKTYFNRHIN